MRWWKVWRMVVRGNTTGVVADMFIITVTLQSHQLVPQLLLCHKKSSPKKPSRNSDRYRLWCTSTSGSCFTESSFVITGRYWGQWWPLGSTLVGCPSAGCCWSPSGGVWWKGCFCFQSSCVQLHASPDWTRSSLPGPAGAAGSSHWDSNVRIILDYGSKCGKMQNAQMM